ncbi:phospholipase D-like domain-containing protein [Bacillus luti]|uniref:phospholipase D-like domain-containing protein n=1 Tax=Bacillus luti TaxID=2026191 RepID=UPI003770A159
MDVSIIEKIHQQYEYHMEQYSLIGSYSVFIPFFKVNLEMGYLYESELNLIEDYICRCIQRNINTKAKIMHVLAFDEAIFSCAIESLLTSGYINSESAGEEDLFTFSKLGKELFLKRTKIEQKLMNIEWYYDGLSNEYKLEFFAHEHEHIFKRFKDISNNPDNIIITPKTLPVYDPQLHYQKLSRQVVAKIDEIEEDKKGTIHSKQIKNIENFKLLTDREIYYHEYRILVYKNELGEFKLLAHDPCGLNFVDQRVTERISELGTSGYFNGVITGTSERQSMHNILTALKNDAKIQLEHIQVEEELEEGENEIRESLQTLTELEETKVVASYIMNYKIRELFLSYLKNTKECLYIISPWMNNYIINNEFKDDIINLLKRGVKIRIICGITEENSSDMDWRDVNTQKIASELVELAKPYGELFKLKIGQTHEKLLICDNKYYINGSFNFLSYSGGTDKFFRNEGSTYSEDEQLIKETIKLRFKF